MKCNQCSYYGNAKILNYCLIIINLDELIKALGLGLL